MKYFVMRLLNWLGSLDHRTHMGFIALSSIPFSQWPNAAHGPK